MPIAELLNDDQALNVKNLVLPERAEIPLPFDLYGIFKNNPKKIFIDKLSRSPFPYKPSEIAFFAIAFPYEFGEIKNIPDPDSENGEPLLFRHIRADIIAADNELHLPKQEWRKGVRLLANLAYAKITYPQRCDSLSEFRETHEKRMDDMITRYRGEDLLTELVYLKIVYPRFKLPPYAKEKAGEASNDQYHRRWVRDIKDFQLIYDTIINYLSALKLLFPEKFYEIDLRKDFWAGVNEAIERFIFTSSGFEIAAKLKIIAAPYARITNSGELRFDPPTTEQKVPLPIERSF